MNKLSQLAPDTLEGRMIAILGVSFVLLLGALVALEIAGRRTPLEWAGSNTMLDRLERMRTMLIAIDITQRASVMESISACHQGYTITASKFSSMDEPSRTSALKLEIVERLAIDAPRISVGYAALYRSDFAYALCSESEIALPMKAIVISVQLQSDQWLNVEVHPHEWHLQDLLVRLLRYSIAFILVGAASVFLIRRLTKPLQDLTHAARLFADGLTVSTVEESGPADLKEAIASFNTMQRQVASDVQKRTDILAAISHDLRTPLTALRIRTEFVENEATRADLIAVIERMEKIIASGLEFIRGESRSEPLRRINLSAMLASECSEFVEAGQVAKFVGADGVLSTCRPASLARATRNLIDNANKYGNGATVELRVKAESLDIIVADTGPGISPDQLDSVREPFVRLSKARENHQGGFGLGLAVVEAVVKGHNGELILENIEPSGLRATMSLSTAAAIA